MLRLVKLPTAPRVVLHKHFYVSPHHFVGLKTLPKTESSTSTNTNTNTTPTIIKSRCMMHDLESSKYKSCHAVQNSCKSQNADDSIANEYRKKDCHEKPQESSQEQHQGRVIQNPCMDSSKSWKSAKFWSDFSLWKRSVINTLHCLVGCTIGDFGMLFFLQNFYPDTTMMVAMPLAMASGIFSSLMLETVRLKYSEKLTWKQSFETSYKMSIISMLSMEMSENIVDLMMSSTASSGSQTATSTSLIDTLNMTAGQNMMFMCTPYSFLIMSISMTAGFLVPLPYNYYKLKKYGKSCH